MELHDWEPIFWVNRAIETFNTTCSRIQTEVRACVCSTWLALPVPNYMSVGILLSIFKLTVFILLALCFVSVSALVLHL